MRRSALFLILSLCICLGCAHSMAETVASSIIHGDCGCSDDNESETNLWYFDGNGGADAIRLILHQAGHKFTDNRFKGEEWKQNLKHSGGFPFLQAPVLEYENKTLSQSEAIVRYLSAQQGWVPTTPEEIYLDSWYIEATKDIVNHFIPLWEGPNEEAKEDAKNKLIEEHLPVFLPPLERQFIASNAEETGYLVGGKLTPATFIVATKFDVFFYSGEKQADFLPVLQENAPRLAKFVEDKIQNEFSGYFGDEAKRPKSPW